MRLALLTALLAASGLAPAAHAEDVPAVDACTLLTEADTTEFFGRVVRVDPGPNDCAWVDTKTYNTLSAHVVAGKELDGSPEEAFAAMKSAMGMMGGKVEDVVSVGDKAALVESGSVIYLSFIDAGKLVNLTASGLPKETIIEAARRSSGRL